MNEALQWQNYDFLIPASQVLTQGYGDCDEWAHTACAMLLKAGLPAKVVLCGGIPVQGATGLSFRSNDLHLSVAYWDGYGWILIDPEFGSGFGILNRVILGADRDLTGVKIKTDPESFDIFDIKYTVDPGAESSTLISSYPTRCNFFTKQMLEHYELSTGVQMSGGEPLNNIVPLDPTAVAIPINVPSYSEHLLLVNYPNPFNPVTTFKFNMNRAGYVRLEIFSVTGEKVETVVGRFMAPGEKIISWKTHGLASGIYFARLRTTDGTSVRKIAILK